MARRRFEGDPIEALRRLDPINHLEAPQDTTGPHARALFQEVTEMETMEKPVAPEPRKTRRRYALAGSVAVVALVAAVGGFALFRGGNERIVGGEPIGGSGMASCLQFDEATLAGLPIAFDGTLVESDGRNATFEVNRWYRGGEGDRITLSAEGLLADESVALLGISLQVGERYLVAGADGFVWACGYTVTYDSDLADQWVELFV